MNLQRSGKEKKDAVANTRNSLTVQTYLYNRYDSTNDDETITTVHGSLLYHPAFLANQLTGLPLTARF